MCLQLCEHQHQEVAQGGQRLLASEICRAVNYNVPANQNKQTLFIYTSTGLYFPLNNNSSCDQWAVLTFLKYVFNYNVPVNEGQWVVIHLQIRIHSEAAGYNVHVHLLILDSYNPTINY